MNVNCARIEDLDRLSKLLDDMTRVICGDKEWDAYHCFCRVVGDRVKRQGYEVYLGDDLRHHYKKIGS